MEGFKLQEYLHKNFIELEQLLNIASLDEERLRNLQKNKQMPEASYSLKFEQSCDSFFGNHHDGKKLEFYNQGYLYWLGLLQNANFKPFEYFSEQYNQTLQRLENQFGCLNNPKFNTELKSLITSEWEHFLDGIYGLCTTTGLPNNIATKEFCIAYIDEVVGNDRAVATEQKPLLAEAVLLLDNATAQFAPHEVSRSSRRKYVDKIKTMLEID